MPHATPRKSLRRKNADLHGSAPDKSEVALILVDVINDLDFPEAKQLARFIPALADSIARLKRRAKAAGVPVIYVNDNFGRWRSDFRALIEHCRKGKEPLAHRKALSGARRLFCIEAEAFRIFFQHFRDTAAIPWRPAPYHNRHCWKFLCSLYRK
jgi:nicotinamidase-related amidase